VPEAELIEAGPDLVGLTDIAQLVGVTRQNMRKLMLNNKSDFPAPIHGGTTMIWHLAPVLEWLLARGYSIETGLLDVARMTRQVNLVKELQHLEPALENRLRALLASPKQVRESKEPAATARKKDASRAKQAR